MRLINIKTRELEEFFDEDIPNYAILSHTWGNGEVSFQDFQLKRNAHLAGYAKIDGACRTTESYSSLGYLWVDTCCIDKSSSTELQEAINSMFRWYSESKWCITYLSDVSMPENPRSESSSFRKSRWFTRGWTLQELLAPTLLSFFGEKWEFIDTKDGMDDILSTITGISKNAIGGPFKLGDYSAAAKMSWAANRETSRLEDMAYCLLGIFDINMPMLYGEGGKAFIRLQEEILRTTDDDSILAWRQPLPDHLRDISGGAFALSPKQFTQCGDIVRYKPSLTRQWSISLTNKGLKIKAALHKGGESTIWFLPLACTTSAEHDQITENEGPRLLALPLLLSRSSPSQAYTLETGDSLFRVGPLRPCLIRQSSLAQDSRTSIYLLHSGWLLGSTRVSNCFTMCAFFMQRLREASAEVVSFHIPSEEVIKHDATLAEPFSIFLLLTFQHHDTPFILHIRVNTSHVGDSAWYELDRCSVGVLSIWNVDDLVSDPTMAITQVQGWDDNWDSLVARFNALDPVRAEMDGRKKDSILVRDGRAR